MIHGTCQGADTIGAEVVQSFGFEVVAFSADWQKHGRAAGSIRTVIGNWIGIDATGTQALGSNENGINLGFGYRWVEHNVISGNAGAAIVVGGQVLILGNFIGTDASETQSLGNGTVLGLGGRHTLVGGTTALERNIIADNHVGIDVNTVGTEYNWIAGNSISTDASGTMRCSVERIRSRIRATPNPEAVVKARRREWVHSRG